jgi:hypothetical protein
VCLALTVASGGECRPYFLPFTVLALTAPLPGAGV